MDEVVLNSVAFGLSEEEAVLDETLFEEEALIGCLAGRNGDFDFDCRVVRTCSELAIASAVGILSITRLSSEQAVHSSISQGPEVQIVHESSLQGSEGCEGGALVGSNT